MSISTQSDFILDAIRAADPTRVQAAVDKLKAMEEGVVFDGEVRSARMGAIARGSRLENVARPEIGDQRIVRARSDIDPKVALGALLLQKTIEQIMPQNSSFFGAGSAGSIWRSTFAEKLAETIAPRIFSGGAGIQATRENT